MRNSDRPSGSNGSKQGNPFFSYKGSKRRREEQVRHENYRHLNRRMMGGREYRPKRSKK